METETVERIWSAIAFCGMMIPMGIGFLWAAIYYDTDFD